MTSEFIIKLVIYILCIIVLRFRVNRKISSIGYKRKKLSFAVYVLVIIITFAMGLTLLVPYLGNVLLVMSMFGAFKTPSYDEIRKKSNIFERIGG